MSGPTQGYLLRTAEPPAGRAASSPSWSTSSRRRRAEQLELQRLREIAAEHGVRLPHRDARALDMKWLEGAESVGITAAPRPRQLVQDLIARLREFGEWNWFRLPGLPRRGLSHADELADAAQ